MKALILGEMVLLYAGGLAIRRKAYNNWRETILATGLKTGAATAVLTGILLTLADMGQGGFASALGALIILGFAMHYADQLSAATLYYSSSFLPDSSPGGGPSNVQ